MLGLPSTSKTASSLKDTSECSQPSPSFQQLSRFFSAQGSWQEAMGAAVGTEQSPTWVTDTPVYSHAAFSFPSPNTTKPKPRLECQRWATGWTKHLRSFGHSSSPPQFNSIIFTLLHMICVGTWVGESGSTSGQFSGGLSPWRTACAQSPLSQTQRPGTLLPS